MVPGKRNVEVTGVDARSLFLAIAVILVSLTSTTEAQNMIGNGSFDQNVTGWYSFATSFTWISDDGAAPSGNGCAELVETFNNGGVGTAEWETLIPTTASTEHTISASVKKPVGSSATSAWILVQYLDGSQTYLGEEVSIYYTGDLSDNQWHNDFTSTFTTSDYVAYLWVRVGVGTPSSGTTPAVLRFDNIRLTAGGGGADLIFSDGFESGDTSQWSP